MTDIVEVKTVGQNRVVYMNGVEQASYDVISEDYAYTLADEFARKLRNKLSGEKGQS